MAIMDNKNCGCCVVTDIEGVVKWGDDNTIFDGNVFAGSVLEEEFDGWIGFSEHMKEFGGLHLNIIDGYVYVNDKLFALFGNKDGG